MPVLSQTRKYPLRANVFRSCPTTDMLRPEPSNNIVERALSYIPDLARIGAKALALFRS
jgi:hypothetical protein